MNKNDTLAALEFKRKLQKSTDLLDFRVFGSRTSHTHDIDSDMDIYIQVSTLDRNIKKKIYEIAWEVGLAFNVVISPLIFSKTEVADSPLRSSSILKNIFQTGIVI